MNNTALVHASFLVIPLALAGVLSLFIFRKKGPHPETFDMSQSWTHDPDPVGGRRAGRITAMAATVHT